MTEYEECLYQYIMDNKFQALYDDREYIALCRIRKKAERALEATLTAEQKRLFDAYMEEETSASGTELRHIFRETLVLGLRLARS